MVTFDIDDWHAYAPGLSTRSEWQAWAGSPYCPTGQNANPSVDFLPAMQRRRLTPMARMVFASAWPLANHLPPMPMVFASRHGDTPQSFSMLNTLVANTPLSPTDFSLSVHNAIPGLWSILRHETEENVALSAQDDTLEVALLEATLLLNEGAEHVMVTIAEALPPQAYMPWIGNVPFSFAIALRIRSGDTWRISQGESTPAVAGWHPGLNTLAHLLRGDTAWRCPGTAWCWMRQS